MVFDWKTEIKNAEKQIKTHILLAKKKGNLSLARKLETKLEEVKKLIV